MAMNEVLGTFEPDNLLTCSMTDWKLVFMLGVRVRSAGAWSTV